MKKISIAVSSTSLLVYVSLSYLTFFAVVKGWLQTDPDILLTREQYQFLMTSVVPPLVAVCFLSTLWFHATFSKNPSKKILQGTKKLVDILLVIMVLVVSVFSGKYFPSSPNTFMLVSDLGNGALSIHHAFSYEHMNNSIQCEEKTCGKNVFVNSLYHNITREEKTIFILGNFLQEQSNGMEIFDAESKELLEKLEDAICIECMSNSSTRCKEFAYLKCSEACSRYPSHDAILKIKIHEYMNISDILKIQGTNVHEYVPKELLTRPYKPFATGEVLEVEALCFNEDPIKNKLPVCEINPNQKCRRTKTVCKGSEIWDPVWESTCQQPCESAEHCERMGFHGKVCIGKSCRLGKLEFFA